MDHIWSGYILVMVYTQHTFTDQIGDSMVSQNDEYSTRELLLNFNYADDRHVNYIPKDKPLGSTTAYLTIKEMGELSAEVNDAGVVLMSFYYRKVTTPKYDFFDDSKVASALGWNPSKTKKTRLALVKAGWIKKIVFTQPTTKAKCTNFYLGKEMCAKVEAPEEYSARIKAIEEKRNKIVNQCGLGSWEEVLDKYSQEEIMAMA